MTTTTTVNFLMPTPQSYAFWYHLFVYVATTHLVAQRLHSAPHSSQTNGDSMVRRAQVAAGELVMLGVYSFGGTTLASMMLGIPAFVLGNKYALVVVFAAYFVMNLVFGARDQASAARVWTKTRFAMMTSAEIFRAVVMRAMIIKSREKMQPENFLTHVIIGFVAGCGGMLFVHGPRQLLIEAETAPSPFFLLGARVALGSLIFVASKPLFGLDDVKRDMTLSVWNISTAVVVALMFSSSRPALMRSQEERSVVVSTASSSSSPRPRSKSPLPSASKKKTRR